MNEDYHEHLRHLNASTPYEYATNGNPDPRSEEDLATDWVDPRLTDIFHRTGLLEAAESAVFNKDFVMMLARIAYGRGAKDGSDNPEAMKKYMTDEYRAAKQAMLDSQVKATRASIARLPETPPEQPNN